MQTNHPSKEVVREYTDRRSREESPPPTPDEIRRELGWKLIPGAVDNHDDRE